MGIYLNPNSENFKRSISADIYVDKTMMLEEINRFIDKGNNYICVSRPRRFGKTIAGNMLSAYYSKGCDSKELFVPFKISRTPGFEEKLNRYNVIKIDMNSEYQSIENKDMLLKTLTREIKRELRAFFTDVELEEEEEDGEHRISFEDALIDFFFDGNKMTAVSWGVLVDEQGNII